MSFLPRRPDIPRHADKACFGNANQADSPLRTAPVLARSPRPRHRRSFGEPGGWPRRNRRLCAPRLGVLPSGQAWASWAERVRGSAAATIRPRETRTTLTWTKPPLPLPCSRPLQVGSDADFGADLHFRANQLFWPDAPGSGARALNARPIRAGIIAAIGPTTRALARVTMAFAIGTTVSGGALRASQCRK